MTGSDTLDALIEAARGQTILRGIGLTDPRSMHETIFARFSEQISPSVELVYRQEVNPVRVLRALRGGERPDFLIVANPARLDEENLIVPFPQLHAGAFPQGWTDPESRWLPLYVQPTVVVYNRYHVGTPPSSWRSVATERWKGGLVLDVPAHMLVAGTALAEVKSVLGDDWEGWIDDLGSLDPLLVADNERSVLEVAVGRMRVGLAPWFVARRVRATSPLSYIFFDPTPCVPAFAALPSAATSKEVGRLFLAWLGSPAGQKAYAATGRIPAIPDLDVPTALDAIMPEDVHPVFGSVSWLTDPGPFVERYKDTFRAPETLLQGKLV